MTDQELNELRNLGEMIREYHGDVKRRLTLCEDASREHHIAIHGVAGDDSIPGLNVQVQALRGFRERVRLGLGLAWGALLTLVTLVWKR